MNSSLKQRQFAFLKKLLPGLSITGLVILLRLLGGLQTLEWQALDFGLRQRPAEKTDERITIVALTEEDIQTELG